LCQDDEEDIMDHLAGEILERVQLEDEEEKEEDEDEDNSRLY
jgi:hypothetical protein